MEHKRTDLLALAILSIYFGLLSNYALHSAYANKIIATCNETPYPEVCSYFIGTRNVFETTKIDYDQDQTLFLFRYQSLLVTMSQAIEAHKLISSMNEKSFDRRAKMALTDCLELYLDSIDHINQSISSNNQIDSQTWLSAAIANEQTCQNGFIDSNLTNHLDIIMSDNMFSNFSKLLSNSLAINMGFISSSDEESHKHEDGRGRRRLLNNESEFPWWLSSNDRKLLQSDHGVRPEAHIIVAQDGSGDFKTINEAVAAASKRSNGKRFVIYVKRGVYKENVKIKRSLKNLMLIGEGIDATIVTSNKNAGDGSTTFRSATVGVSGPGFIAKGITFENTAGPEKHQAVALRSSSDFSVFYSCSFKGYQDTLYVHSQRQFYRNCDIYGTIDFIFGDAVVVFQNCNIFIRKPLDNQKNTVTAQGRKDPNENTGIIIHNSHVTATPDLRPVQGSIESYLGRPWKMYSRTVFMKCDLDGVIDSAGWLPWNGDFGLKTLYYGEFMNVGAGSGTSRRVKWPGYRVITSSVEAGRFSVGNFLAGDDWIPASGVPFESGI